MAGRGRRLGGEEVHGLPIHAQEPLDQRRAQGHRRQQAQEPQRDHRQPVLEKAPPEDGAQGPRGRERGGRLGGEMGVFARPAHERRIRGSSQP